MTKVEFDEQQWEFVGAPGILKPASGEADTPPEFPRHWRAYGPVPAEHTRLTGRSLITLGAEPLVSADVEALREVPEQLTIGDQSFDGQDTVLNDTMFDFDKLFDPHTNGQQVYAIAEFEVDEATEIILGAGADWWMQVWIDGKEVLSTLENGNQNTKFDTTNHCVRHTLTAGKHLIALRSIRGGGSWHMHIGFVTPDDERYGTRQLDRWEILPDDEHLLLPPMGLAELGMALRTDKCIADETVECDFQLHDHEGQFGIVFGAQDSENYYWAYYPRWGQNWRARAVYAVIAKVESARGGHARGLAMMLMPNVIGHINAKLSIKVERRGNQIQMYMNGVKGPSIVDNTFGAGFAGVKGHRDFEVRNFKASGNEVADFGLRIADSKKQTWFNLATDFDYGALHDPATLMRFQSGELLAGISSREGLFHGHDPEGQVQLYRSQDAGHTWQPHGDVLPMADFPHNALWGIRWFEPRPGVIRAFSHGPAVTGAYEYLEEAKGPEEILTFRDSDDFGITWSEPQTSELTGDWSTIYGPRCNNHIYGFTKLDDGTLLAVFLHMYNNLYDCIPNHGQGTWGTEIAQPYASRSEDGGLTWQPPVPMDNANIFDGQPPQSPNGGFSETVLAQLPNGRIAATCRPFRSPYSWLTFSDDNGQSWRQSCYAPFSIAGGPQMVATASGYLALVGRQTGLGLHTSVDGGLNWDAGTLLDHDCWFNGHLIETEPDVILLYYFNPGGVNTPAVPRMQHLRITPEGPEPVEV